MGYIAKELTKFLHPLIALKKITDVGIKHIKFRTAFKNIGYYIMIIRMYTHKKNYILQLKVSCFHDHQAILQPKDQSYILYCEIGGTFDNNGCISKDFRG